jgi:hypothetical protein
MKPLVDDDSTTYSTITGMKEIASSLFSFSIIRLRPLQAKTFYVPKISYSFKKTPNFSYLK